MSVNALKASNDNALLLEQKLQNCSQNIQDIKEFIAKEIAKILVFVTFYTLDEEKFKFKGKQEGPHLDLKITVQNDENTYNYNIMINLNLSALLSEGGIVSVPLFSSCFSTYSQYALNPKKFEKYKRQFKRKIETLIKECLQDIISFLRGIYRSPNDSSLYISYYNYLNSLLYNKLLIPLYKEYKVSVERNFDQIVNNLASNNNIDITEIFSIIM